MAKYGEGDKRWIVEERSDGTNVHNWHWAETNCLEWSRSFLNKALSDLNLLNGEGNLFVRTKKVEKLDGEAYVNIRKGKIIPGYELNFTVSFEGEARDSDGKSLLKTDGTLEIPYLSDENADENPEIKITVKDDGPIGRRVKEAVIAKGKPILEEKIKTYVVSMARGGPAKDEMECNNPPSKESKKNESFEVKPVKATVKKEKTKKGVKRITASEKFSCSAKVLYEIMMDENRWKGFTQSNARISKEVGGEFAIFDGSVTGRNMELVEGQLIVQQWRFGSWPDGAMSTVRLEFEEPEDGIAVVKLTHTDIPEEDRYGNATVVENTDRGWRDLIFNKIRAVFGFGL